MLVPILVLAVAIVGNLFGHYMFAIDEGNVYHRQPLSYVNYAMMFVCFFYSIWLKHRFQRAHGRVRFFNMGMFLVPVFVGAAHRRAHVRAEAPPPREHGRRRSAITAGCRVTLTHPDGLCRKNAYAALSHLLICILAC